MAELGQFAFASSIIATAEMICPDGCRVERVELALPLHPSMGSDALAFLHRRQGHARQPAAPVDMHGACSALIAIASFLCAGQRRFFTQCVKQRHARFDHDRADTTVDSHLTDMSADSSFGVFAEVSDAFASGVAFDVGRLELLILRCLQLIFFTQWAAGFAGQKPTTGPCTRTVQESRPITAKMVAHGLLTQTHRTSKSGSETVIHARLNLK